MDHNYRAETERRGGYMCGNYYCMSHVIRKGDTLYRLSREYGVKVSALMMANPFVDIYNLRIGDELCIPRLRSQEAMPAPGPIPAPMPMPMPIPSAEPGPAVMPETYNENDRVIDAEMRMERSRNDRMPNGMENTMPDHECSECTNMGYSK